MTRVGAFARAIRDAGRRREVALICDIKPVSPRDGNLLRGRAPEDVAESLARAGACALSVVTEGRHFGGSLEMLRAVARATSLPVLRKDFLSRPEEVDESREAGASAVLVILATTSDPLAAALVARARELGLEAVVEAHTRAEVGRALALGAEIVGINNRDIARLETDPGDVTVTEELAPLVPDPALVISESSLRSAADVRRAVRAGADAVLIGTSILQADRMGERLAELRGPGAGQR